MSKRTKPAKPAPKTLTDKEIEARDTTALNGIERMDDPTRLRNLIANATRMERPVVRDAAFRRLAAVQSDAVEGTVEDALWQAIHAVEEVKRERSGKTIRLSYLRRDIEKLGIVPAIDKLVSKPGPSERYDELTARGMPELTAEAVVLRFADEFSEDAVARSRERLGDPA